MNATEPNIVFAGVDGQTDSTIPAWYREQTNVDDPRSFSEAIRALPRAVETTVAYHDPFRDAWIPTDRFNALIDPSRLRAQQVDADHSDPLFHIPTASYTIINPVDVFEPLEAVLRKESLDGQPLGDLVFGEIR